MTEDQKARLSELLPSMRANARRMVTQNEYNKAWNRIDGIASFLRTGGDHSNADHWLAIAEKAAAGAEKPGVIKGMTMEQVLSGLPPEHFKREN